MDTSESVADNWVRELRSVQEDPRDSLREDPREELTAQEKNTGSQPDDERSLYDGGEG
ncbi:MAG: hypothetical protein ABSF91_13415 [Bacteroidota bacterium]|jgi:hypothetical protein